MSGHSHWSTIKRKKGIQDQKRGQIFSKLAKAISLAAKDGADPATNFKLRLLMEKAKQVNMPKDSTQRAIEKGSGQSDGASFQAVTYEGYGPAGVALIVETVTDNRNRTTAAIKNIFDRAGGRLAQPGAVAFQFKKAGLFLIKKTKDVDDQLLKLMDLGVDEVEEAEEVIEVIVSPEKISEVKSKVDQMGFEIIEADLINQPQLKIKIDDEAQKDKVLKLFSFLEEDEDVQRVDSNLQ